MTATTTVVTGKTVPVVMKRVPDTYGRENILLNTPQRTITMRPRVVMHAATVFGRTLQTTTTLTATNNKGHLTSV